MNNDEYKLLIKDSELYILESKIQAAEETISTLNGLKKEKYSIDEVLSTIKPILQEIVTTVTVIDENKDNIPSELKLVGEQLKQSHELASKNLRKYWNCYSVVEKYGSLDTALNLKVKEIKELKDGRAKLCDDG